LKRGEEKWDGDDHRWPESGRGMWCGAGHGVNSLGFVGSHVAKSALSICDRTRELRFDLQSSRPRDIRPAEAHAGATAASDGKTLEAGDLTAKIVDVVRELLGVPVIMSLIQLIFL
jgi:hypothetical protein